MGPSSWTANETLLIKTCNGAPLTVDSHVLRCCSSCARGLPPDAEDWDVSGVLIEGQPVTREVVLAWVNAAFKLINNSDFEKQDSEHDLVRTMDGLYQLLAFADAVGSVRGLMCSCVARLDDLRVVVRVESTTISAMTDGRPHSVVAGITTRIFAQRFCDSTSALVGEVLSVVQEGEPGAGQAEAADVFRQQAIQQTEALLWLAYKLQLPPLISRLHEFIRSNLGFSIGSLLGICHSSIFTPRVLDAALGANQAGKDAWLRSVRCKPCVFLPGICDEASVCFKPMDPDDEALECCCFKAVLLQDYMGVPKGTVVQIELDLFGTSRVKIGSTSFKVSLLLG